MPGVCDIDGSELVHRADDAEATVRARMEQQLEPLDDVADYYRAQGILDAPSTASSTIEDVRGLAPAEAPRSPAAAAAMITRKSAREIEQMRRAGRIVAEVLALVESELKPGVADRPPRRGSRSATSGPPAPFRRSRATSAAAAMATAPRRSPASTCISIDCEVVHGIPGERDASAPARWCPSTSGAIVDGWHGDGARTFVVGDVTPEAPRLGRRHPARDDGRHRRRTGRARASATSRPRSRTSATAGGYGIVRPFVGHGIGTEMHQDPQVPNYRTGLTRRASSSPASASAIEPMFTLGDGDVYVEADGWTVATADDSPGGPLRAHDRNHCTTAPDPDAGLSRTHGRAVGDR